jgi:hypothetical protein
MGKVETPRNSQGLVLLPLPIPLECLGSEECRLTGTANGCFTSFHHLYFYKWLYEQDGQDSLHFRLRQDRLNIIPIARCRHDELHDRFAPPPFPRKSVIREFLNESYQLQLLGDVALDLADREIQVRDLNQCDRLDRHKVFRLGELCSRDRERVKSLGASVQQAEFISMDASESLFKRAGNPARQPIRELASQIIQSALSVTPPQGALITV